MMMEFVVVCQIVVASGWMQFNQKIVVARSDAACHDWSNKNGGQGMVAHFDRFNLSQPDDIKKYELRCGPNGSDCVHDATAASAN